MSEKETYWMQKMHTRLKSTQVGGLECEREVWEDKKMKTIERDRGEMKKNRADPLYRKVIKLDRSRAIERC